MANSETHYLWLDGFAARLGFGWLSEHLPYDIPPSYLYAIVLIAVIEPVLTVWGYFAGYDLWYVENPYAILQPFAFIVAIYASRRLMKSYDRAMEEMEIERRTDDSEPLLDIIPSWLPWTIFILGATYFYLNAIGTGQIYNFENPIEAIAALVINPLVWTPIGAQFISVYYAIELLAPWRFRKSDIGIHFMDPEGIGGLRPIGELIKEAYYYMITGLVVYALILYHPFVDTDIVEVSEFANIIFTTIWIVSITTVGFAVITLHRFMHKEKRKELNRLRAKIHRIVEEPYDVVAYSVPEENQQEIAELRRRMKIVSSTQEFPATYSIWSQLLLAVILPKAIQLVLENLAL